MFLQDFWKKLSAAPAAQQASAVKGEAHNNGRPEVDAFAHWGFELDVFDWFETLVVVPHPTGKASPAGTD